MKNILLMILVVMCLCGCRHVECVSVPEVHTKYEDRFVHDTQYHDHYYTEYYLGDTLVIRDSSYHYYMTIKTDSIVQHDTVLDTSHVGLLSRQLGNAEKSLARRKAAIIILAILLAAATITSYIYAQKYKNHRHLQWP